VCLSGAYLIVIQLAYHEHMHIMIHLVEVCVCVCVCVCYVDRRKISDEFARQDHRSMSRSFFGRFKVTQSPYVATSEIPFAMVQDRAIKTVEWESWETVPKLSSGDFQ